MKKLTLALLISLSLLVSACTHEPETKHVTLTFAMECQPVNVTYINNYGTTTLLEICGLKPQD
jgi:hypothetical protein